MNMIFLPPFYITSNSICFLQLETTPRRSFYRCFLDIFIGMTIRLRLPAFNLTGRHNRFRRKKHKCSRSCQGMVHQKVLLDQTRLLYLQHIRGPAQYHTNFSCNCISLVVSDKHQTDRYGNVPEDNTSIIWVSWRKSTKNNNYVIKGNGCGLRPQDILIHLSIHSTR